MEDCTTALHGKVALLARFWMRKTEQKRLAREGKNCFEMEKEELIDNMN